MSAQNLWESGYASSDLFLKTLAGIISDTMKDLIQLNVVMHRIEPAGEKPFCSKFLFGASAKINCSYFSGNVVIGFDESIYREIMSRFLEMEIKEVSANMHDGGAELLNVMLGLLKSKLNQHGFNISTVFPEIVTGAAFMSFPVNVNGTSSTLHYQTDSGEFKVLFTAAIEKIPV